MEERDVLKGIPTSYLVLVSLTLVLAISSITISLMYSSWQSQKMAGVAGDELLVVGDENLPPFSFMRNGVPTGYDVDIIRAIGNRVGKKVVIRLLPWTEAMDEVKKGKADVLIGISQVEERRLEFEYTSPTLTQKSVFFVDREQFQNPVLAPLEYNGTIAIRKGGIHADPIRSRFPNARVVEFPDPEDAIQALSRGDVDMYAGNYYAGLYDIQLHHLGDRVKVLGTPFHEQEYGLAVTKGNYPLLSLVNLAISDLRGRGEIQRLQDTWFGQGYFGDSLTRYLVYGLIIALVSLLIIILYSLVIREYSLRLHHDIEARTAELRRSEELLKSHYSILHGILESTETGVYSVDTNYRYTSFNTAHIRTMKELYGAAIAIGGDILEYIPFPEDCRAFKHHLSRSLAGERFIVLDHVGGEEPAGAYHQIIYNPVINPEGMVIGAAVFSRDVTELKMMSDENREALLQISRNMATLAALNDQMRNPLTIITILSEERREENVEKILEQVRIINEIITRLDRGWVESDKVRRFLVRHYGMEFGEEHEEHP